MAQALLLAIPIVLFVLLALAFAVVLRRAARVVAETRRIEGYGQRTADVAGRIAASLTGACERIDAVRRGHAAPDTISETLDEARAAMERYRTETEALVAPNEHAALRTRLVDELGRATRGLEMVDHGCSTLEAARLGRASETEGQTAIKRGYLNILHAREAMVEIGTNARSARRPPASPGAPPE